MLTKNNFANFMRAMYFLLFANGDLADHCKTTNNFITLVDSTSRPRCGLLTKIEVEPIERERDE